MSKFEWRKRAEIIQSLSALTAFVDSSWRKSQSEVQNLTWKYKMRLHSEKTFWHEVNAWYEKILYTFLVCVLPHTNIKFLHPPVMTLKMKVKNRNLRRYFRFFRYKTFASLIKILQISSTFLWFLSRLIFIYVLKFSFDFSRDSKLPSSRHCLEMFSNGSWNLKRLPIQTERELNYQQLKVIYADELKKKNLRLNTKQKFETSGKLWKTQQKEKRVGSSWKCL